VGIALDSREHALHQHFGRRNYRQTVGPSACMEDLLYLGEVRRVDHLGGFGGHGADKGLAHVFFGGGKSCSPVSSSTTVIAFTGQERAALTITASAAPVWLTTSDLPSASKANTV